MKIVGLITEYNPFHNGHQYHIEKAKELSGADRVVVVMSGNYVQRGTPAFMPKDLRTEIALKSGVSLVLELPTFYATGTAEQFAYGAVSILHKLGCVDSICFGSECGDIRLLTDIANIFVQEPDTYKQALQEYLKAGLSFPLARQKAIGSLYPDCSYDEILSKPNNILGIEYLKALIKLNSTMVPLTICRHVADYHDADLKECISSASAIHEAFVHNDIESILKQFPTHSHSIILDNYQKKYPITADDFSLLLKYRLLNETKESIQTYADVSEELANRIYKQLNQYASFEQFCELLKTKEVTYTRISRALLHILLGIKKTDQKEIKKVRVLGFQKEHSDIFTDIKKQASITLVSKLANDFDGLEIDIQASNLYESVLADKFRTTFINEYEHPIIRI